MTGKRARREGEGDGESSKKKIAIPNSAKQSLQGLTNIRFDLILNEKSYTYTVI